MRLDRFLSRGRIADLQSRDLRGALHELLGLCGLKQRGLKKDATLDALLARENLITTYLGNGVALPHIRLKMRRPAYLLAVGRSPEGIPYNGLEGVEQVRLVFMLLASDQARDYLHVLAAIARLVRERELVDSLVSAPDSESFADRLIGGIRGVINRPVRGQQNRMNRLLLRQAERIARGAECTGIVVFGDVLSTPFEWGDWFGRFRTLLVAQETVEERHGGRFTATLQVRAFSGGRLSQLRSALLVALTRRLIHFRDRLCCVGGAAGSNRFDTVMVVDVEREFQNLLADPSNLLPPGVKPEVLERLLSTAVELAVEGREGRPVGALFVVGDAGRVERMTKPLVLNPFFGYREEDRNILNPFMDETLKEFSSLDGAFVIRGDGVVLSAGSLILAPDYQHDLPGGLGARHAAAAAVTKATESLAIVVSSSTGQVTVFRRGFMLPLLERSLGGTV